MENNTLARWVATPTEGDDETLLSNCVENVSPLLSHGMASHFGYKKKEWGFIELDWVLVYAASAAESPRILEDLYETGLRCMRQDMRKKLKPDNLFPLKDQYQCKSHTPTLSVNDNYYKVFIEQDDKDLVFELKKESNGKWVMLVCFCDED